jgi:hypothetical protein
MLTAARRQWPKKKILSHDEADALWIFMLHVCERK